VLYKNLYPADRLTNAGKGKTSFHTIQSTNEGRVINNVSHTVQMQLIKLKGCVLIIVKGRVSTVLKMDYSLTLYDCISRGEGQMVLNVFHETQKQDIKG